MTYPASHTVRDVTYAFPALRLPVDEEAAVVDLDGAIWLEVTVLGPPVDQGSLLQLLRHLDVPVQLERLRHRAFFPLFALFLSRLRRRRRHRRRH